MEKIFEYKIEVDSTEVDAAITKVENLGNATGDSSKKAVDNLSSVGQAAKSSAADIEKLGTVGKTSMQGLSGGFKGLTVATKGFDKALKANHIFLLLAIILPLIQMIKGMLDQMGLLTIMTDALSAAMEYLISMFKLLTDWMGITDNAGDDRAANALKNSTDIIKALEDEEKAYSKVRSAIEKTEDAQRELDRKRAQGTADAQQDLDNYIEDHDINTQRQIDNIKRLENLETETYVAKLQAGTVLRRALKKGNKEEIDDARAKYKDLVSQHEGYVSSIKIANEELDTADLKFESGKLDRQQRIIDEKKRNEEKWAAKQKAIDADRIKYTQELRDLEINAMGDDTEREIAKAQDKFERLERATKENVNLSEEQKTELILAYEKDRDRKITNLKDERRAKEEAAEAVKNAKEISDSIILAELDLQLRREQLEAIDVMELAFNTNLSLDEKLQKMQEEYAASSQLLEEQKALDLEKLKEQYSEEEQLHEEFLAKKALMDAQYANKQQDLTKDTESKKNTIEAVAADKSIKLDEKKSAAMGAISENLLGSIADNLEEGSDAAKGVAAAQAGYATFLAAINAYNSMLAVPVAGPALGVVAAGAATVFGLKQIKSILSTDPKGPNVASGGSNAGSITTASSATPQFNFLGNPNETGGDSSQFDVEEGSTNNEPIRAIVSWTDIDAVGKADSNIRREMQL